MICVRLHNVGSVIMSEITVSIIIPVFNVAPYLRECLDSLYAQSLSEERYEVICVNDGSTDGSDGILKEFAAAHGNMRVFEQENSGVSAARNTGLDHATGEYVWFVDSDDFIATDILEKLTPILNEKRPDLLFVLPIAFEDGSDTSSLHTTHVRSDVSSEKYAMWLWTRLYRKSMITESGVRFKPGMGFAEDNLFCAMLRPYSKNEVHTDEVAYFYRRRNDSVSGKPTKEKLDLLINACVEFTRCAEDGKISTDDAAFIISPTMITVMSNVAAMSRLEARNRLRSIKLKGLFPLRKQYRTKRDTGENAISREERIRNYLKNRSYTVPGYYALRVFRFMLRLIRRFKITFHHD